MSAEICFDRYLAAIVDKYKQWWRLYTLTDVTGRSREHGSEEPREIPLFDFGLTVQTVQTQKEREQNKEKIEQLPVLEGIRKYASEHVLLVGRPGSGKSTALARLLLDEAQAALADRQAPIPVLLELRYLPSEANQSSVTERILAFIHTHDPALDLDEAVIKLLLRQGRLLLLFDGLNELPSEKSRNQVSLFRHDYQKSTPAIFTTRDLSVGSNLGIEKRLEMQPLTEPQMQEFVRSYLPTQGDLMLQQLGGRLREFGQTPLLLLMLCELFKAGENIPRNLGEVFRVFTGAYEFQSIRNHEIASLKGDVQPLVDRRLWFPALKHLASVMMQGATPVDFRIAISRVEVEKEFKALFRDEPYPSKLARDCLDDLINYHLLQIYSEDYVEFRHQLIQEYYAAEYLFELLPNLIDARLKYDYLNYLKWTEPLALMLDLVESEEQAVLVVRLALDVDLKLGARLAGALKYGFQEKTVELLILEIDDRKIPQLYAIELLGETRSGSTIDSLIAAFKDSDSSVRRSAAHALGEIGGEKAIDALIAALKDLDNDVRSTAAEALGEIGGEKAVDSLIAALKDSDNYVRWNAAEALDEIGGEKAIDALIAALNDSDNYVRWIAAQALVEIGSKKAIDALIAALNGSDNYVRWSAAQALVKIGNEKAVDSLITALIDSDNDVCWSAAHALGEIGNEKAVDFLIATLKDSDDSGIRRATNILVKIGNEKTVDALIAALNDSDDTVRSNAAEALGEIGNEKTVDALIAALNDSDDYVRWHAAHALVKIGNEKAVGALIVALNDSDDTIRSNAAEALGKIGNEKTVDALIAALNDSDNYVRRSAAEALGRIGNEKAVDSLIAALKDSDNYVRRSAANALGEIGNEKAVDALIAALNDSDDTVRSNTAEALGKIGDEKAVDSLITALKDSDSRVRWRAAEALGEIGNEKAVNALIATLKDSDNYVRRSATEALATISESDCNLPTLTQQLPHLISLIPTEASEQALSVIAAIQSRCKYYNYAIAQMTLPEVPQTESIKPYVTNNLNFYAPVEKVVGNIEGNQNNYPNQTKPP